MTVIKKKPRKYLSNANLLAEIAKSHQRQREHPEWTPTQCVTNELCNMIMLLVARYGAKWNFQGYTYRDDMEADAILGGVVAVMKFNPEKSQNPFAYLTQVVHRCFITYIEKEKKLRTIRDDLIEMQGCSDFKPSFARQHEEADAV